MALSTRFLMRTTLDKIPISRATRRVNARFNRMRSQVDDLHRECKLLKREKARLRGSPVNLNNGRRLLSSVSFVSSQGAVFAGIDSVYIMSRPLQTRTVSKCPNLP